MYGKIKNVIVLAELTDERAGIGAALWLDVDEDGSSAKLIEHSGMIAFGE